jgi:Holliday junction resolvasome RuvABC DNA-binding subunit
MDDAHACEQRVHDANDQARIRKNREMFALSVAEAVASVKTFARGILYEATCSAAPSAPIPQVTSEALSYLLAWQVEETQAREALSKARKVLGNDLALVPLLKNALKFVIKRAARLSLDAWPAHQALALLNLDLSPQTIKDWVRDPDKHATANVVEAIQALQNLGYNLDTVKRAIITASSELGSNADTARLIRRGLQALAGA